MAVQVPPIKSQGIKTKLVPWINDVILRSGIDLSTANWIEPFFGTGVVGFNSIVKGAHIVGDTNPHIINFYKCVQSGEINAGSMRMYLKKEGAALATAGDNGYEHYKFIRDRFNSEGSPFDFIFLSRAGFNGMMRFNKKGQWNIPFCKKPERFAQAYITKICNQISGVSQIISQGKWSFDNIPFFETIAKATENDIIYCDPPYYGRYVDYYNGWTEEDEERLYSLLRETPAKFILSTWHHNEFRGNDMMDKFWNEFNVCTKNHFYHSGGNIENRHSMVEALVFNFDLKDIPEEKPVAQTKEPSLFDDAF
jgi:DNA adenine methylase